MKFGYIAFLMLMSKAAIAGSGVGVCTPELKAEFERLVESMTDGVATPGEPQCLVDEFVAFATDAEDAVVMFTLEGFGGSNHSRQYMALYSGTEPASDDASGGVSKKRKKWFLLDVETIGVRMLRQLDHATAAWDGKTLMLTGMNMKSCCDGDPVTARFSFDKAYIEEIGHKNP